MYRIILVCVALATGLSTFSQPEYYGCHHFRNLMPKHPKLTAQEKAAIEAGILRSDTINIIEYAIHLDVTNEAQQAIAGWTTISYNPLMENVSSITLDLYQLTIDSISDDSGLLDYSYDDECLRVYFSETPLTSDTSTVSVYYHGTPHQDPVWGGFYFELGYVYNLGIGLSTIPPNFGKVWYPCFDTFVERAAYQYFITSANNHKAFCQGDFISEEALGGDTVMRHYIFDEQIPTYLSAIAVSNYTDYDYIHEGANGEIPVRLTARETQMTQMQTAFQQLGFAIDALEYWYGPYIWDRVGYILTTDGALEIPTNIAYPQSMLGASLTQNGRLFTHELGHHWWGDVVTLKEHNHMWIKEGPAEYSAHLFVEWKDGQEAFVETVKDNQLFVLEQAHYDDNGFQQLAPIPDEHIYGRHTYYKGAAVLHNLRGYLGDDLFRSTMTAVQTNHPYNSYLSSEFRDVLMEESGYDLTSFFDDWIFQPGFSVFVIDSMNTIQAGNTFESTLFIQQKLREAEHYHTNVPIDVSLYDENWERTDVQVMVSDEFSTVSVETDFNPVMVCLNGANKLNQARMDHTIILQPDQGFNQQLPFVDMRVEKEELADSAYVRIEHIWAAPDNDNVGEGIWQMAERHYWRVDGNYSADDILLGRITYTGTDSYSLDYDLCSTTEEDLVLVFRPNASEAWEVYPDYVFQPGNLTTATGTIKDIRLRKGEYALANGDQSVDVSDVPNASSTFALYPNPTKSLVNIGGFMAYETTLKCLIYDASGRLCKEFGSESLVGEFVLEVDVAELKNGHYVVSIVDKHGIAIDQTGFQIIK
jgi:hypothetical protein